MKKTNYIFIIIVLVVVIGMIIYFGIFKGANNTEQQIDKSESREDEFSNLTDNEYGNEINDEEIGKENKETQLSTFSTQIKDNSPGRLTNIRITCDIINGTVLEPSQTFSFNEIVGQPSVDRGYQEATVIIDGEHETGIGGGNCQVSSTLYNAILAVPTVTVVERHAHGGSGVTYVPYGKDAAVSYGSSLDLKFRNDNDYRIKINLSSDDKNIAATLIKVEN